jgi:hypothetical protein
VALENCLQGRLPTILGGKDGPLLEEEVLHYDEGEHVPQEQIIDED